jgi:hypothetical protein
MQDNIGLVLGDVSNQSTCKHCQTKAVFLKGELGVLLQSSIGLRTPRD